MKKLYWFEWDIPAINDARLRTGVKLMGGLGLNLHPTHISHKVGGTLTHGMLSTSVEHISDFKENNMEEGKLVSVKNLVNDGISYSSEVKEGFITAGEDFYNLLNFDIKGFQKAINDKPYFLTTEDGKETKWWHIRPLLVLPMYDGKLDEEYGYWEMMEEGGYVYGMDKRTLEIHELQHIEVIYQKPFSKDKTTWEAWVISNQPVEDLYELLANTPQGAIDADYAKWVMDVARQHYEFKIDCLQRYGKKDDEITVERMRY